jgi:hypothetical protein
VNQIGITLDLKENGRTKCGSGDRRSRRFAATAVHETGGHPKSISRRDHPAPTVGEKDMLTETPDVDAMTSPGSGTSFFDRLFSRKKSGPMEDGLLEKSYAITSNSISRINRILGLSYSGQPRFVVAESGMDAPASTSGDVITLNRRWFREHPNDDGCIVHELVHVVMHCPRMDDSNWWMIEGIADYVRDKLGYTMPWSSPVRGDPRSGYQATAHFLLSVEKGFGPDYIREIASTLSDSGDLPRDIDSKIRRYVNG